MTSVIVPAYQAATVVARTVPATLALEGVDEWVWVDDGSTDETRTHLEALVSTAPGARLIIHTENKGRGAARNTGAEAARGDRLVFFDVDVAPPPEAVLRLGEALDTEGAVAAIARISPVLDAPEDPYQRYLARHRRGPQGPAGGPVEWRHFLSGACVIQRDTFVRVGGFDPSVPYGEDFELACRLSEQYADGLRLADTSVAVSDVKTLGDVISDATRFGGAMAQISRAHPSAWDLAGLPEAARSPLLRSVIPLLSVDGTLAGAVRRLPARFQPRAVRYLIGLALLSGYHRA